MVTHSWVAFGDIHLSTAFLDEIEEIETAESLIITGDITNCSKEGAIVPIYEKIAQKNSKIYAQPGNMDKSDVASYLDTKGSLIHAKVATLSEGVKLMGVGYSTTTPFNTPGEVTEAEMAKLLEETYEKVGECEKLIVAVHDAPYGTSLDMVGGGAHVGSESITKFIDEKQPDLLICGHIHESAGIEKRGKTLMINAGMVSDGGYVLITYDGRDLKAELKRV